MINPESTGKFRFALFANGANFSCRVLQHLKLRNYLPELIVLPDYPAVSDQHASQLNFRSAVSAHPIVAICNDIPIEYAPRARQHKLTPMLKKFQLDYLLVACWPYLIDAVLTRCATKAALNLHPSLLPRYRGPDPVEMQLNGNEINLGVTLHLLSDRFDRGDIVMQAGFDAMLVNGDRLLIENHCARAGVELFIEAAANFDRGWNLLSQSD